MRKNQKWEKNKNMWEVEKSSEWNDEILLDIFFL